MKRRYKKSVKIIGIFLLSLIFVFSALFLYVISVTRMETPAIPSLDIENIQREEVSPGFYTLDSNWFRKSETGWYELFVKGEPFERGVINGKLTKELVFHQEEVFTAQINQLVPSAFYRKALTYFIGWFNRDLEKNIPLEFQQEIYGISLSASHQFDFIAPPFQRLLNYHAAHDIGHALQNMSLVGCSSFATWGQASEEGQLIIGRNFDFYVGDEFARDKIIAFYQPSTGHKFMMVTFGGMTGVLSGMNEKGLTVTINAAKSDVPSHAATPVSLVAREVLQYAGNIEEALAIARKRDMFVSESFLIGSALDGKAIIIEKTPETLDVVEAQNQLVCTNHFKSEKLGNTELNKTHMTSSASGYRYDRIEELLREKGKNSILKTLDILRDQKGLGGQDIGLGNEKLINQLISHHGIIFLPAQKKVWISTGPWQLGKFVCYDLEKVFQEEMKVDHEVYDSTLSLPGDPFLKTKAFQNYVKFHAYRFPFQNRENLVPDSVVSWNPESYLAYMLAGDKAFSDQKKEQALHFYEQALQKEIANDAEKIYIEKQILKCKKL